MDRDAIRVMIEDYWRSFLPVAFRGDRNAATRMITVFQRQIDEIAAIMPEDDRDMFLLVVEIERTNIADEYDRDPRSLKKRLGVPEPEPASLQPTVRRKPGTGELVVRTAVRATVWETVISLFRLFRA